MTRPDTFRGTYLMLSTFYWINNEAIHEKNFIILKLIFDLTGINYDYHFIDKAQ